MGRGGFRAKLSHISTSKEKTLFVWSYYIYISTESAIIPLNAVAVVCSVVTPSSFVYGNTIDASRFVLLEDMECHFQPLNLTFQVSQAQIIQGFWHFYMFLYMFTLLFFLTIFSCLCAMLFQAINNGPSRLPGSTVDIRIPNRLAGSGADMFHIIETQVDANSTLSAIYLGQLIIY